MARTDLKISTKTSEGKSGTTTVSYVNPEATAATLKELAAKLVNLTDDTYISADRVNTVNVDTESPTIKQTPTFTFSKTVFAQSEFAEGGNGAGGTWPAVSFTVTTDSDGVISITPPPVGYRVIYCEYNPNGSEPYSFYIIKHPSLSVAAEITFGITETDNFKGATQTITIQGS